MENRFDGSGLVPPVDERALGAKRHTSVDPRIGLRIDPWPWLTVKANAGTYFRPPNFGELFGDDGFSAANPRLQPERGASRDAGIIVRRRGRRLQATAEWAFFDNEVDDMIVFVPSGARVPRPQNIGAARLRGHELRLKASAGRWNIEANYTRQVAIDRSSVRDFRGKDLPAHPRDEAFARVLYSGPTWRLSYEIGARSQVFLDRAGLERVPGYARHAVVLEIGPIAGRWRLRAEADNLTDRQFSDVFGFPVPGRAFYVTLSYGGRPQR